jgi:hypothetical protein
MNYKSLRLSYKNHGYCLVRGVFSEDKLAELRDELLNYDALSLSNKTSITWADLPEVDLNENLISKIFFCQELTSCHKNIFFADNSEIMPPLELMKNYLPHSLRASWHRDCDGELAYEFCKDRLHSEDYLFGKIGIFLQSNGPYGGAIDIIPRSNYGVKKKSRLLFLLTQSVAAFFNHYPRTSKLVSWIFKRRLRVNPGDVVFFDSRTLHRGSPAFRKIEKTLKYSNTTYQASLPQGHTKVVLYAHFGNAIGKESYLYDRSRRPNSSDLRLFEIFNQQNKTLQKK